MSPPDDFTLAAFVEKLERHGELERHRDPVSLRNVTGLLESSDKAIMFEKPLGCDMPLLANAMASRARWALALDVPPQQIRDEILRRLVAPVPPVVVDSGPVHEVCHIGEDADLTRLPAYLQHEWDGGPYISAAIDITRDPSSGQYNAGVRRLMLRGRRETGVDMVAPSDLRAMYRRARQDGRTLQVAFVVGAHPLDYLATQLSIPGVDEYSIMGALRGCPMRLVRCQTVDLEVPCDAELVLEGQLEGDWTEAEGPFGEYTGCYGRVHHNPVFRVTAVTHRRDAVFETATIGGAQLHHTDTAGIVSLATEVTVWDAVCRAVAQPFQVYCPPAGTGLHHTRVALRVRDPGDGRNAIAAALSSRGNTKHVIAVDDDIDVFSDSMVEWAIATRFQADRDLVVLPGMRTLPLDPSLPPHEGSSTVTAKMGIDATRRHDRPGDIFAIPLPPFLENAAHNDGNRLSDTGQLIGKLRQNGEPRRFVDWLRDMGDVHQGDLVRAFDELREKGLLWMDDDGRYHVGQAEK
ncbi:MAG: UbiD family decarboxylase [Streptosporangiales bacterium]|nr:UbiD family decarboxylase [Streptosporangiales bacterium]